MVPSAEERPASSVLAMLTYYTHFAMTSAIYYLALIDDDVLVMTSQNGEIPALAL